MTPLARILMIIGGGIFISGLIIYLVDRSGIVPFKIPGDIRLQFGNATCIIALGTSIFLSIFLTIILNLVVRLLNK